MPNHASEHRRRIKKKIVDIFGGKCYLCGYNKCTRSLSFHHVDPKKKKFNISRYTQLKWRDIVEEIKKCVMICSNCHGEVESGLITISLDYLKEVQSKLVYPETLSPKKPPKIKKNRIIKRPSKEILKKMIWTKPSTYIAKEFNVSDSAVVKWCRIYGIKKPPRGYWSANRPNVVIEASNPDKVEELVQI